MVGQQQRHMRNLSMRASLGIMGDQLRTPETTRTSQHYRIEEFKGGASNWTPIIPRVAIFSYLGSVPVWFSALAFLAAIVTAGPQLSQVTGI